MGAYSRWALIRGWALIRINTVRTNIFTSKISGWYRTQATQPGVTGQDGQRQERDRFKDFPKQFSSLVNFTTAAVSLVTSRTQLNYG